MAVELARSSIPNEKELFNELKLIAKTYGGKNGYKPQTPELFCYEFTKDTVIIPLVYAMQKYGIKLKDRPEVSIKEVPTKFRGEQEVVFKEAMEKLRKECSVFLNLRCSFGKTFCSIRIIAQLKQRTLILVHRRFLADQFLTEGERIIPGQMKFIEDSEVDENTPGSVFVCTDIRANKLPESFRKTISFIVVDEAKYMITKNRVEALLKFRPKYTLGLCAERERRDGYGKALEFFFGYNIFRASSVPFKVWKFMTDFKPEIVKQNFSGKVDWNIAMQSLCDHNERNEMIVAMCQLRKKDKIMILLRYKKHVELLRDMLIAKGESVDTFYGSKDSYKNCRILIATYSKAEMGFDDANLCENFDGQRLNLLILGAFYKKEIMQSLGRVFRSENPECFDIVDDYSTLKKHSNVRDRFYKSICGEIQKPEFIYSMEKK